MPDGLMFREDKIKHINRQEYNVVDKENIDSKG